MTHIVLPTTWTGLRLLSITHALQFPPPMPGNGGSVKFRQWLRHRNRLRMAEQYLIRRAAR